ncbi:hypothetical protein WDW89_06690 [Deltaproteobacteria bacterium TL4]
MNKEESHLKQIKQELATIIPAKDGRSPISPLAFVVNLIFCYLGDTKKTSLETIRRQMMGRLKTNISRGAFWERLARNRLKHFLIMVVSTLISKLSGCLMIGSEILPILGISGILLVDSSSFTLWDGAKNAYPGTFTNAAIKWHECFDLLSGKLNWFKLTAGSTHDRQS